jgi:hypothetical protein
MSASKSVADNRRAHLARLQRWGLTEPDVQETRVLFAAAACILALQSLLILIAGGMANAFIHPDVAKLRHELRRLSLAGSARLVGSDNGVPLCAGALALRPTPCLLWEFDSDGAL